MISNEPFSTLATCFGCLFLLWSCGAKSSILFVPEYASLYSGFGEDVGISTLRVTDEVTVDVKMLARPMSKSLQMESRLKVKVMFLRYYCTIEGS